MGSLKYRLLWMHARYTCMICRLLDYVGLFVSRPTIMVLAFPPITIINNQIGLPFQCLKLYFKNRYRSLMIVFE